MIELPASPAPSSVEPSLIDFGFVQRPGSGAAALRIDRGGNRHAFEVTFPPMEPATARVFLSRLQQAKSAGLRLPLPLLGVDQGAPGSPAVNGTDSAGTVLKLDGLRPGYVVKEGFWLTLVSGGAAYLHMATALVVADGSGLATLSVEPPLRVFPADGDTVELAAPYVEGIVTSELSWPMPTSHLISLGFTLEEAG